MNSLGMTLGNEHSIRLWASRSESWACLVIEAEDLHCEIRMDPAHVGSLRDHLPTVLAGLDRSSTEDSACEQAELAAQRVVDAAAAALDQAVAADKTGAPELAISLRAAVADATAKADAVDAAVRAFDEAAAEADLAAERLTHHTREAKKALTGAVL